METVISYANDSSLRRVLIQRMANNFAVAKELNERTTSMDPAYCCWVTYPVPHSPGKTLHWVHKLCTSPCPHWHHQIEIIS
jgi:hypothetical protein